MKLGPNSRVEWLMWNMPSGATRDAHAFVTTQTDPLVAVAEQATGKHAASGRRGRSSVCETFDYPTPEMKPEAVDPVTANLCEVCDETLRERGQRQRRRQVMRTRSTDFEPEHTFEEWATGAETEEVTAPEETLDGMPVYDITQRRP